MDGISKEYSRNFMRIDSMAEELDGDEMKLLFKLYDEMVIEYGWDEGVTVPCVAEFLEHDAPERLREIIEYNEFDGEVELAKNILIMWDEPLEE